MFGLVRGTHQNSRVLRIALVGFFSHLLHSLPPADVVVRVRDEVHVYHTWSAEISN